MILLEPVSICKLSYKELQERTERFELLAREQYVMGSPRVDLLLTLIHYNVWRALSSNNSALGFNMEWLDGGAVSPFNSPIILESYASIPLCLRPSQLQHTVEHHPWIDLLPFPALRDNLLCQGDDYDDNDICHDVVEIFDRPSEEAGLIVWGEPSSPFGWEASEDFVKKWAWALVGCSELLESTNYWRLKRGETILEI